MLPPSFRTFHLTAATELDRVPATATKGFDEVLDYGFDYSDVLEDEAIVSGAWSASEGVVLQDRSVEGATSIVWIGMMSTEGPFEVTNTVSTGSGRQFQSRLILYVRTR